MVGTLGTWPAADETAAPEPSPSPEVMAARVTQAKIHAVKTLALYNLKGGVGKTAGTVNLGHLAAESGLRTLIWDLDPQGAATFYFRIRPKIRGGRKELLTDGAHLGTQIRGTDYERLDLIPADFSLRKLDVALGGQKAPEKVLRRLLDALRAEYDVLFLDCPPSISTTSEAIFRVADALLVPLIPTTLSLRTLHQLLRHLDKKGPSDLPVWPFFSMVDRRKRLHREILMQAADDDGYLKSAIPYASDVERMGVERRPVATFAPLSPATGAYHALWNEVAARAGLA
ncbi:MAG: AAA family ATPase [Acidobacteriota bacterium]